MSQQPFNTVLIVMMTVAGSSCSNDRDTEVAVTPARQIVLSPSAFLPRSMRVSEVNVRSAIDQMGRAWSYPTVRCTSLQVISGNPVPRRLAAEDGFNLVVFRGETWCHNDRCGKTGTFPLRAAAMTTLFPEGARSADVREGDIEINAVHDAWLEDQSGHPNLRSVLLHEIGHVLGFPDLEPLPAGAALDTVMREGSVAERLTERDVQATCKRFPR
jgi:hypothetical protein